MKYTAIALPPIVRALWTAKLPAARLARSQAFISSSRLPRPSGGTASLTRIGKASSSRLAGEVERRFIGAAYHLPGAGKTLLQTGVSVGVSPRSAAPESRRNARFPRITGAEGLSAPIEPSRQPFDHWHQVGLQLVEDRQLEVLQGVERSVVLVVRHLTS